MGQPEFEGSEYTSGFSFSADGMPEQFVLNFFAGPSSIPFDGKGIVGIGVDICSVPRVQEAVEHHSFYTRVAYTAEEIAYCEQAKGSLRFQRYADRFAGKEAVAKAIGGIPHKYQDISIHNLEDGKPFVELYGRAKEWVEKQGIGDVFISLSNVKEFAIAFAVAIRKSP